jgi:Mn2+/Fe2+ NRAMP family transporter
MNDRIADEERRLEQARAQGPGATLRLFARLSGPGWLQSAITLGGGSLAGALYLGVLSGYGMLWLQVVAMLLGVVMLSAIGYVTLSTGERPFGAICKHISPVLGWGWLIAVLLANLVWALPQFSLGTAALQQNLVPALGGSTGGTLVCVVLILGLSTAAIWSYGSGARGAALFEWLLKGLVGLVVLCFVAVALTLAFSGEGLPWGQILAGLLPDPSALSRPAPAFAEFIEASAAGEWWSGRLVSQQQDVMIAAAATAVGINMTFLLPYSMLNKGWGRQHRGLAIFDLGTGLLIPFALATGCVVVASASQFHGRYDAALVEDPVAAAGSDGYLTTLDARLGQDFVGEAYEARSVHPALRESLGPEVFQARVAASLPLFDLADRQLAAMLLKRDAVHLAGALEPLTGHLVAQLIFGIGVLGMAVSTVIILMLISGFAFCEAWGVAPGGKAHRAGALVAGLVGALGPFVWKGDAKFYLAVPTSMFGMALLPIAYWTFFLMMNSRGLLGEQRPKGRARVIWNSLMLLASTVATFAAVTTIEKKLGYRGLAGLGLFLLLALAVHLGGRGAQKLKRNPM